MRRLAFHGFPIRVPQQAIPYLFILPFLVSFLVFFAGPFVYSLGLSLHRYRGYGAASFVGLANYRNLLLYPDFWLSVRNTFFYFVAHWLPVTGVSFVLAYGLWSQQFSAPVTRFYKTIIFMPRVVSVVAAALLFRVFLSTRVGVVNSFLGTRIPFLEDYVLMRWSVVSLVTWRAIGWFLVVYLAGLTTVSDDVLDSTRIDGANFLQRLVYIVLPIMKPIFLFAFIMDTITSMRLFTEPNVLMPALTLPPQVQPMVNVLTRNIDGGNYGMAASVGWVLFLMTMTLALILMRLFREKD